MSSSRSFGLGGAGVVCVVLGALVGLPLGQLFSPLILVLIVAVGLAIVVNATKAKESLATWALGLGVVAIAFPVLCLVLNQHRGKVIFILLVLGFLGLMVILARARVASGKARVEEQRRLVWGRARIIEPEESSVEPWRQPTRIPTPQNDTDDDLGVFGGGRG